MGCEPERICCECNQPLPDRKPVRRGPWMYHVDPVRRITFEGLPFDCQPQIAKILGELITRGKASRLSIAMVALGDEADWKAIDVQMCRIRRMLPHGWRVVTLKGWGYELCGPLESVK